MRFIANYTYQFAFNVHAYHPRCKHQETFNVLCILLHYKHFINVLMHQRNSIITNREQEEAKNKIKTKSIFIKWNQIILKELKRK